MYIIIYTKLSRISSSRVDVNIVKMEMSVVEMHLIWSTFDYKPL